VIYLLCVVTGASFFNVSQLYSYYMCYYMCYYTREQIFKAPFVVCAL